MALVNTKAAVQKERTFSDKLTNAALEAARCAHLSGFYEDRYKEARTALFDAVAEEPGVVVGPGQSLGKDQGFTIGSVQCNEKYEYVLDKAALYKAIRTGKLSEADFEAIVTGVNTDATTAAFDGTRLPKILERKQAKNADGTPAVIQKFVPSKQTLGQFIAEEEAVVRVDNELLKPLLLPTVYPVSKTVAAKDAKKGKRAAAS